MTPANSPDEARQFLVRQNIEYSLVVSAVSEDEAIEKAAATPLWLWDDAFSGLEIDEDYIED